MTTRYLGNRPIFSMYYLAFEYKFRAGRFRQMAGGRFFQFSLN